MRNVAVLVLALSVLSVVAMAEEGGGPVLSQPLTGAANAPAPATPPTEDGGPTTLPPGRAAVTPPAAAVAVPPAPPVESSPAPHSVKLPPPPPVAPVAPLPPPSVSLSSAPLPSEPVASVTDALPSLPPLAAWLQGLMLLAGALIAGVIGMVVAVTLQGRDLSRRRRAIAATLAIEIEARRQAFAAVPSPPNAEAGVSFVSAVSALADFDCGWRSAQGSLYLLPDKLAGHLSVHYGAVHHVAAFVKGQSFAAALRMLQANRIGGHPCPDAVAMREAHVELAAAFRGVDKLLLGLKALG